MNRISSKKHTSEKWNWSVSKNDLIQANECSSTKVLLNWIKYNKKSSNFGRIYSFTGFYCAALSHDQYLLGKKIVMNLYDFSPRVNFNLNQSKGDNIVQCFNGKNHDFYVIDINYFSFWLNSCEKVFFSNYTFAGGLHRKKALTVTDDAWENREEDRMGKR